MYGYQDEMFEVSDVATHKIRVCDTFDYEDYDVFVHEGEDANVIKAKYDGPNMQRVHEVIELKPPIKCPCYMHWR